MHPELNALPLRTARAELLSRLKEPVEYDIAVVGGGATGLGVALDAVARGFKVVLLESRDFAEGTSSRATKLVHGGVRYLAQGNISLVREALHERTTLLNNAPHLARPLAFVMPSYKLWETPFYGIGLKMYDALAGKAGLGATQFLSRKETMRDLPTVQSDKLKGGVKYWDGQFDDARLALALARTAAKRGALIINYCSVDSLKYENGRVCGLECEDAETHQRFEVRAHCVVNATGVWVDTLREKDGNAQGRPVKPMVAPSQGAHLIVDRDFLPTDHALMVPKTADGRVLFAVPWLGKVILGTTDSPKEKIEFEPRAMREEVSFILGESARYLRRAPQVSDVRSIWAGLRPLVKHQDDDAGNTKKISREHTVLVSRTGLVTVTGGKWTTYRSMAEDVLQHCMDNKLLPHRRAGLTVNLPVVGSTTKPQSHGLNDPQGLHSYGSEADFVQSLDGSQASLAPGFTESMVRFAARYEYARNVEDVLARRVRMLFLDARQAASVAPAVAEILQEELGADPQLDAFLALAQQYASVPAP
ncbi:glycerol-3-phosphate dehydrogenase/oxidase [Ottowia thiooxydans]|uniref:Glycerol-3-phosphate dehydrogenase n=1 Tax=Ottowia thiooxydans TaxID=219182 RepID=A0ABV2QA55_9BURK